MVNGTRGFKVVGESVVRSRRRTSVRIVWLSMSRRAPICLIVSLHALSTVLGHAVRRIVAKLARYLAIRDRPRVARQMGNTCSAVGAQRRQSQRKRIQRDTPRGTEREEGIEGSRGTEIGRRRERAREQEGDVGIGIRIILVAVTEQNSASRRLVRAPLPLSGARFVSRRVTTDAVPRRD